MALRTHLRKRLNLKSQASFWFEESGMGLQKSTHSLLQIIGLAENGVAIASRDRTESTCTFLQNALFIKKTVNLNKL